MSGEPSSVARWTGAVQARIGLPTRVAFLTVVFWGSLLLWLISPSLSESSGKNHLGRPLLAEPLTITGVVQGMRKDTGELEVTTEDGSRFLVIPNRSEFQGIPATSRVKMTVIPIRYTSGGIIISHYSSLEIP